MKSKIAAYIILATVFTAVGINSVYLSWITGELYEKCATSDVSSDLAEESFEETFTFYKKHERIISLTVNHDDLTAIEEGFCEIIGSLSVGDKDGAAVIKSRLIGSLEHLRRLSGINIESVI